MKTLPLDEKVEGVLPFLQAEGLVARADLDAETRPRIEAVILALGDRLKVFSDILKLGRYFFTETLTYDPDAVKKRLRKEGVPAMLARARRRCSPRSSRTTWRPWRRPIHDYAESNGLEDGRRRQPAPRGDDRAGGRPGPLRLPGDPRPRDLPRPDRGDAGDARRGAPA